MTIVPSLCKKGHPGPFILRTDSGTYRCQTCTNLNAKRNREASVAKGLTTQGKARSEWLSRTTAERFWQKVLPTGFCWYWTAHKDKDGYGKFGLNNSSVLAHRWAYEELVEPIATGYTLDHLCRNTSCVNPDHLEQVTFAENVRRGFSVNRKNREKTHCAKRHEYTSENTYLTPKGFRRCRTCVLTSQRVGHDILD